MQLIEQTHYGNLEIIDTESDIIQIWNYQSIESNVVFIEREKLQEIISKLQKLCN